jgi:serine palmitoyltransferase
MTAIYSSDLPEVINEKLDFDPAPPKRTSFPRMNNRFTQFFNTAPRKRDSRSQSPAPDIDAPVPTLIQDASTTSTVSLPTISLSTAASEYASGTEEAVSESQSQQLLFEPMSPEQAKLIAKQEAQYGTLTSKDDLHSSAFEGGDFPDPVEDEPPYFFLLTTYLSYLILIIFGHVRDFFGKRFREAHYRHLKPINGLAPLNSDFENFYVRRLKMRINDVFARPITGVPGRFINLLDRYSDDGNNSFQLTGSTTETLNMSSYNYLGFAQSEGPCADATEIAIRKYGVSMCSPRADVGTSDLHIEVEDLIAKFVGKPAAMVFSMGFVTNAAAFPALLGKGCLIISDELNHSSIRTGTRLSGAIIQTFKHNDMASLEKLLRESISQGQPRTHRPWKKIMVAVEGLYSMEGTMCNLPGLLALRKQYKFTLFIDEAHSIGALGPQGRGVCDYFGIDPNEVDILMGTLTKSFGANGGYIAANAQIIAALRKANAATIFGESPAPPVLMQIASALRIIIGELVPGQGEERLLRLAFNARYLRLGLKRLGFIVYGHDDSPIIPLMLYHPAKMSAFSHEMLARKISVVVVGYPATPLISSRARFCVSAAHNKEDLDRMLKACDEIGDILQLKFSSGIAGGLDENIEESNGVVTPPRWKLEDVLERTAADVKQPLR